MNKKKILICAFIILHVVITIFTIRIIDATVQIDGHYLTLVAVILIINLVLYILLCKVYNFIFRKKKYPVDRAIFDSSLPAGIDWNEINEFLRTTKFYKEVLFEAWHKSNAFTIHPVSDTSIDCLKCLHEDLVSCYKGTFALDENGNEDRNKEYSLLRHNLESKYNKIDKDLLERIYFNYLKEDR